MGKSSRENKGNLKKKAREEEKVKLNACHEVIKAANSVDDPLAQWIAFQSFKKDSEELEIRCKKRENMSEDEISQVFTLVESNMKSLYEASNWGWSEKEKKKEMTDELARYLLVTETGKTEIVGMVHFRFDLGDDDVEVLYCYEIQLLETFRGKGLGKRLMMALELMGKVAKMQKIVLTVFKANTKGINFFTGLLKYEIDCTCMTYDDPNNPQDYDYLIYSKSLQKPKPQPLASIESNTAKLSL